MDHIREMWSVPILHHKKSLLFLSTDVQLWEEKYHSGSMQSDLNLPPYFFFMSSYVVLEVASCCARLMLIDTNKKETHHEIPTDISHLTLVKLSATIHPVPTHRSS